MAIKILFADLRLDPPQFEKLFVPWQPQLTAQEAVEHAFEQDLARQIGEDLKIDNGELTVSWNSLVSDEHGGIGGVDSLNWEMPDNSILSIIYENDATSQQAIDNCITWMLSNEKT